MTKTLPAPSKTHLIEVDFLSLFCLLHTKAMWIFAKWHFGKFCGLLCISTCLNNTECGTVSLQQLSFFLQVLLHRTGCIKLIGNTKAILLLLIWMSRTITRWQEHQKTPASSIWAAVFANSDRSRSRSFSSCSTCSCFSFNAFYT